MTRKSSPPRGGERASLADHVNLTLRAAQRLLLAICLAALPFELDSGLGFGPLTLTNVELLILGSLGLWAALLAAERRQPALPAWLPATAAAVVGALALSAALAEAERAGALKFALRQGQGALLALCVADTLRRGAPALLLAGPLLAGAGLSAALGLLEMSEAPAVLALLAPFKAETTYMGGLLRLSGTFSYANTAAQYFEALLPTAVLLAVALWAAGGRRQAAALALAAPLLILATLLTYSRAALAVTAALLALAPLAAGRALGAGGARGVGLVSLGLAAVGLALAAASPTFRLRVAEPEVASWYGARYSAAPLGPMAPNELREVPVAIENSGKVTWQPDGPRPVRLAYHWLDADTGAVVRYEGRRTMLPRPVAPGEALSLTATVQAPERPGRYVLVWDMLREYIGRGWFSQMGVEPARVTVEVTGAPAAASPPAADPPRSPREVAAVPGPPGRRELWGVALAMWREGPVLGVGPDVFRHTYGPRLGLSLWDDRVHTNSLYLELLAGAGAAGLLAFLALAGATLWAAWGGIARRDRPAVERATLAGAALGVVAYLGHGVLDVFLAFTPTYALLWGLVGIVGGLAPEGR